MSTLIHTESDGTRVVRLDPGKRVLFLTKDLELIRKQLAGEVDLSMADVDPADIDRRPVDVGGRPTDV